MEYKKVNSNSYIIRIIRGEKIIASLKEFCLKGHIQGGFFFGLGAVLDFEVAHYNVEKKLYSSKKYTIPVEMTNITGNIAYFKKEIVIHTHATFSDEKMQTIAGHLVEATISGTAEIYFFKTPRLNKFYDEDTGLKLFRLAVET